MPKYKGFKPEWCNGIRNDTYRDYYKWGDKSRFYQPSEMFYGFIKEAMNMTDDDFSSPDYADEEVVLKKTSVSLDNRDVEALRKIVGEDNVSLDIKERIKASITKNVDEIVAMHEGKLPNIVDCVISPCNEDEIRDIIIYCQKKKINYFVKSTLIPKSIDKKTIAIDLTKRFNRILEFNEVDSYIRVESGIYIGILEGIINNAPQNFKDYKVEGRYTIGHFPIEFEECTIYDSASGIKYGTESGYYGTFDDIIMSKEYVGPEGITDKYTEGAVLTSMTLIIRRYYPHNRYGFSYMFRSWQEAQNALREIYSRESAIPCQVRLSDARETSMLMRYYLLHDSIFDSCLKAFKYNDGERCLLVGFTGGTYTYARTAYNIVKKIAKKYRAISMTSVVADAYSESRYNEMYVRECLGDFGIVSESNYHELKWSELPVKYNELVNSNENGFTRSRLIAPSRNSVVLEVVKMKK